MILEWEYHLLLLILLKVFKNDSIETSILLNCLSERLSFCIQKLIKKEGS